MSRIRNLFVVAAVLLAVSALVLVRSFAEWERGIRIVFLSVGEGDAILITEGKRQVLIDGGSDGTQLIERIGAHVPFYDRTLEAVIATHPDADHIGGLSEIFRRYRAGIFLDNGGAKTSGVFQELNDAWGATGSDSRFAAGQGTEIIFPSGAKLALLAPEALAGTDTNTGSIIAELTVTGERFVFLADAPADIAEKVLAPGPVAVLKVSHHGARRETNEALIEKLAPRMAVIPVGKNRYGHPAEEVLSLLAAAGVPVLRTDRDGDVVFRCDAGRCERSL